MKLRKEKEIERERKSYSRISTRSWLGVLGVAGTLLAFLLKHVVWQRCIGGSSFRSGPVSSRTSLSVLPVYLNFVPQEKMEPPLTTGASDARGKLRTHRVHTRLIVVIKLCCGSDIRRDINVKFDRTMNGERHSGKSGM